MLSDVLAFFERRAVTAGEIDLLRPSLENGWLKLEIEAKLGRLRSDCPDHAELKRLVSASVGLLEAVDTGRFDPGAYWVEIEPRLLRALAYFVREGDAIPDHLPGGFDDDMREFAELAEHADAVFALFEASERRRGVAGEPGEVAGRWE
jgi:hypothetical protein